MRGAYNLFLRMVFQIRAGVGEVLVRVFRVSWVQLMFSAGVLLGFAFLGRFVRRMSFRAEAWVRVTSFAPLGQ